MNGTAAPDDRLTRKRALESELEAIRIQKAEVLKAIQQIAKKQKLGGPPSKNVALTHEAKVAAEKRNHQEHLRRIWGMCSKIIAEMVKNTNVRLYFGEPVHRDKFPGYYETIKDPRDLGTIKAWIETNHYHNIREFRDDVRLCFYNCRLYNPVGHQVRKFGDTASDQFEKKWENRKVEEEWDAEMERHRLTMARLEAEAKSLPDKIKEVEAELQDLAAKAVARNQAPPPGPGREMTFEEKRKLSHMLGSLPGERLARVLEIVAAGPSADTLEGDEECEFDIDALDAGTLWKLQAYVDSVNAEIDTKAARPGAGVAVPTDDTPMAEAAPTGGATADAGGAPASGAGAAPAGGENATSEEVGSKGNADSTGADPTKSNYSNNPATDIDIEGEGEGNGADGGDGEEKEKEGEEKEGEDGEGQEPTTTTAAAPPAPGGDDVVMAEAAAAAAPPTDTTTTTAIDNTATTTTTELEKEKEQPAAAAEPAAAADVPAVEAPDAAPAQ